ncbi:hypothetical protein [Hymenobacter latericus]|uniref:hypothetical protein n=1 Tax=Hymenobacter sp. YIM 151858-1 TaxID=2987688 RepID=UPI002225DA7D|nr:hypothetical protein [Hymenobacter sp. YIM 151858-1]UYZ59718.1 hypothetical protein OIS50_02705 [Hymenobacter sp. YIM 151858-1]
MRRNASPICAGIAIGSVQRLISKHLVACEFGRQLPPSLFSIFCCGSGFSAAWARAALGCPALQHLGQLQLHFPTDNQLSSAFAAAFPFRLHRHYFC